MKYQSGIIGSWEALIQTELAMATLPEVGGLGILWMNDPFLQ